VSGKFFAQARRDVEGADDLDRDRAARQGNPKLVPIDPDRDGGAVCIVSVTSSLQRPVVGSASMTMPSPTDRSMIFAVLLASRHLTVAPVRSIGLPSASLQVTSIPHVSPR
jgi:hypothetical protein